MPGHRIVRRPTDTMLTRTLTGPVSWIWAILAVLIAATALVRAEPLTALSIGFAAGLSLAGSI